MNEFLRIAAHVNPMVDGLDIYIVEKDPRVDIDERRMVSQIIMEPISELTTSSPPFWITRDNAKKLMDDLWNAGIRPSDLGESEGALKATKMHLQDMRRLAFEAIGEISNSNIQDRTIDE